MFKTLSTIILSSRPRMNMERIYEELNRWEFKRAVYECLKKYNLADRG